MLLLQQVFDEKGESVPLRGHILLIRKRNELVAEAADSYEVAGFGRFFLDVPAQTHDEIVDGARVRILVEAPYVLEDRFSGNRMAGVLDQIAKKLRFHQGELQALVTDLQPKVLEVKYFFPKTKRVLRIV